MVKSKTVKSKTKTGCKPLTVRFDRYPDVFELLVDSAHDNCRSLNDEVIYCVKEQVKFECQVKDWESKK